MAKIPGDFVPLNVRYRRDRAIRRAGVMAELLYIRSLALVKRDETGGVIEDYDLDELTEGISSPESAVAALVTHQLWITLTEHSWSVRSWQKWNPSEKSSAEGKRGNHVRWHEKEGVVKPDCPFCLESSPPNRGAIGGRSEGDIGGDIRPDSQVRVEKRREEKNTCSSTDVESEFAEWYSGYPRKVGKGQALKAYKAARKKVDHQTLIDALAGQLRSLTARGADYVPYPATWLNGERWADEGATNVHQLRSSSDEGAPWMAGGA